MLQFALHSDVLGILRTPRYVSAGVERPCADSSATSSEGPLLAASRSASATSSATRRVSFARFKEPLEVHDLLALQTDSFDWLLGNERWRSRIDAARKAGAKDVPEQSGLEEIFEEISPIEDFTGTMSLSFRDHRFKPPMPSVAECKEKDQHCSPPMCATAQYPNNSTGEIKRQTVFMGAFPL